MAYPTYLDADNVCTRNEVQSLTNESSSGTNLQQYTYTYDLNGNITGIAESVSQTTQAYTYDGLNRLTGESNGTDAYVYAYDAGGNLTSVKKNGATQHTYVYGNTNWKDQLTSFDGKDITYDANGNPLSFDGNTYSWQRGTLLAGISGNSNNIAYVYDSQGHRVQKTVNGTATSYLYSGDLLVRQTIGANTLDFRYDSNGSAIGFIYNGADYYYVRNLQGDIVSVVDADGAAAASYTYDAWGNILSATGAMAAINPLRYRGYYYDAESGYYYLNSRYYSPEWRRFISADSLFIAGNDVINGSNMYAYCNGNPVMYVDFEGTKPSKVVSFFVDTATIIGWFIPEIIANRMITDRFGGGTNDFSGYSEKSFLFKSFIPFMTNRVLFYSDIAISPIVGALSGKTNWIDRVYETDIGLRNTIWPFTMVMGARLGAFFLEFFPEKRVRETIYTTKEGQYQWQHKMGYNWYYDAFFSLGGPIRKLVYDFESTNDAGETKYYAVWCWKGDYWNLGAGAEIGIYYQENAWRARHGFYDIDKDNLKVKVHMKVDYQGSAVEIQQTNWWVTLFRPKYQSISIDDLHIWQAVSFNIPVGTLDANGNPYITDYTMHNNFELYDDLHDSIWKERINAGYEENLRWGPTPPATQDGWNYLNLNGSYYGAFQFYIKF